MEPCGWATGAASPSLAVIPFIPLPDRTSNSQGIQVIYRGTRYKCHSLLQGQKHLYWLPSVLVTTLKMEINIPSKTTGPRTSRTTTRDPCKLHSTLYLSMSINKHKTQPPH